MSGSSRRASGSTPPARQPRCPACSDTGAQQPILARVGVPLTFNRLYPSADEARRCRRGELEILRCEGCGLVYNGRFEPEALPYDAGYWLDNSGSERYRRHLAEVARLVLARSPTHEPLTVLEVAAGNGAFLSALARCAGTQLAHAVVYEPAWRPVTALGDLVGLTVTERLFDAEAAALLASSSSLVVARHLIEHVAEPVALLRLLARTLRSPHGRLHLETPSATHALAEGLLHELYYEHCRLFSPRALEIALERAGLVAEAIQPVFGGEYLLASAARGRGRSTTAPEPTTHELLGAQAELAAGRFVEHWRAELTRQRRRGPVALWGAAGKGGTFAEWIDPDVELISCLVDLDPKKRGTFVAGSAHPVVSPTCAQRLGVRCVLVANPRYAAEIAALSANHGIDATQICIDGRWRAHRAVS